MRKRNYGIYRIFDIICVIKLIIIITNTFLVKHVKLDDRTRNFLIEDICQLLPSYNYFGVVFSVQHVRVRDRTRNLLIGDMYMSITTELCLLWLYFGVVFRSSSFQKCNTM